MMKKVLILIALFTSFPSFSTGTEELTEMLSPQYWNRRLIQNLDDPISADEYHVAYQVYLKAPNLSPVILKRAYLCLSQYIKMVGEDATSQDYKIAYNLCSELCNTLTESQDKKLYAFEGAKYLEILIQKEEEGVSQNHYRDLSRFYFTLYLIEQNPSYLENYNASFDLYCEMAGENFSLEDYLQSIVIYNLLISNSQSSEEIIEISKKILKISEKMLSKEREMSKQNYLYLAICLFTGARCLEKEDPNKFLYYSKASECFAKGGTSDQQNYITQILALTGAGENACEKDKNRFFEDAAKIADIFLKNNWLAENSALLIGVYENAKSHATEKKKIQEYQKKLRGLYKTTGISRIHKIGDKFIAITQNDSGEMLKSSPLQVKITPDLPEDGEDTQSQISPEKISIQGKDSLAESGESQKAAREEYDVSKQVAEAIISQVAKEEITKSEFDILSQLSATKISSQEEELEQKAVVEDGGAKFQEAAGTAQQPLKKAERKKKKSLAKATLRKEATLRKACVSTSIESSGEYITVDPTIRMCISKAYEAPQDQKDIFTLLNDMDTCKGEKVTDGRIFKYMQRLKYLLSGEERETREGHLFNILGIHFGYAPAHGSRGGEWDKGMIKRFVNFSKNIRTIFEAIINERSQPISPQIHQLACEKKEG